MQRVRTLKGSGKNTTTFYYLKTDESTKIKSMKNKIHHDHGEFLPGM